MWKIKKRTQPLQDPCIIVDYTNLKREWYVYYKRNNTISSCTVDDITGATYIIESDKLVDQVD
jgi:hypothetical protein